MVNAQTESEHQVPFSTEQARLDMARLLSQMNRDIELGNDIDLNLLLTRLGFFFPLQDDPTDDNSLQAALFASVSHVPQSQRRNELEVRQADLGNAESHRGNVSKLVKRMDRSRSPDIRQEKHSATKGKTKNKTPGQHHHSNQSGKKHRLTVNLRTTSALA